MKNILVIQTASIGDVILSTPIIEKLHFHYPEAAIDFLIKKGNEPLFENHPFLHKILVWDKSKDKYKNLFDLMIFIRHQKYDCVINVQRFASSGLLTISSGAKLKIGFNKNPLSLFFTKRIKHTIKKGDRHEADRNLELVRWMTDDSSFPVRLYPNQNHFARMSQYKTVRYITISPASLWFTKQFPVEKWIEFVKDIHHELRIYFLGSVKDHALCENIIKTADHPNTLNLSGKLSFLESAALMKDAQMNFVNDSAPMHFASALNAPTAAIFCSTVPEFGFGPLSENSAIIQTSERLDCRPCGLHGFNQCPKKHFKCAITINKEKLLMRLD